MKIQRVIKIVFSLATAILISATTYAQSAQELDIAKEYAKSMGYSDAEIDQALLSIQGASPDAAAPAAAGASSQSTVIDRNFSARDSMGLSNPSDDSSVILAKRRDSLDRLQNNSTLSTMRTTSGSEEIFGRNIFLMENLNFVPNYNIPTPKDYKLAAGDEVIIDIWGDVITNITETISPEGYITIPDMGLMYLAGMSVEKAEDSVRRGLSKIYSKISNEPNQNQIKLSLGKTRSVTVNVVGDVALPGSYTVPSLSTIAMVMYMSGGPIGIGSVRNIHLYRDNKLLSTFDVYDFLLNGVYGKNIRLEDNDIISVAPYSGIISIEGGVKRPMKYEIIDGEILSDVIGYAGGFSHAAFGGSVVVERVSADDSVTGATSRSFVVQKSEFDTFKLMDGDKVIVSNNLDRFANRATIYGAVWRGGSFAIGEGENQASDLFELIEMSGGLRDDAYLKRGYIERYGDNRIREQIAFSPSEVLLRSSVVEVKPDDVVRILSIDEITTRPTVNIAGEVNNPNQFEYRANMTLGDLILMAGGISDGATLTNIEIARRQLNAENQEATNISSIVTIINLLKNPKDAEMVLMPYDMIFIRKSINYEAQMSVSIKGEVSYPGTYVIENNTVRLSDLINNAGGLRKDAYAHGASLKRVVTTEDITAFKISQDITLDQNDPNYEELYNAMVEKIGRVAIDLNKALDNPGSVADVVLKEGDIISIPQFDNTINIVGHVMNPNSVVFYEDMKLKDYISMAGGFQKRAMKKRIYVIQMNGMTAKKGSKNCVITPGSTIVVPEKPEKNSLAQTATIVSTFSTLIIAMLALFI